MIIERIMKLLAPVRCLGCGSDDKALCEKCMDRALDDGVRQKDLINRELQGVIVGAQYRGVVKELIWRLKFHRLRAAAEAAADLVLARWPGDLQVDLVTAVPVSPTRRRERGYNQAELIARKVARELGVPYRETMWRQNATHQVGLDRKSRLAQIAGVFLVGRGLAQGGRVLVVDDVVTTGATLMECARVLRSAGATEVWGAAVARGVFVADVRGQSETGPQTQR